MKFAIQFVLVLICFANLSTLTGAQTATDSEIAQSLVQAYREISGVPGMAIAVAKDGKIVYQESFGSADLENISPARADTRFRLGSVSKVITIAAAARLHERGQLDIDAPLQTYVPSFPDNGKTVTIRMLAGHLGGIRHYVPADFQNEANTSTPSPMLYPSSSKTRWSMSREARTSIRATATTS